MVSASGPVPWRSVKRGQVVASVRERGDPVEAQDQERRCVRRSLRSIGCFEPETQGALSFHDEEHGRAAVLEAPGLGEVPRVRRRNGRRPLDAESQRLDVDGRPVGHAVEEVDDVESAREERRERVAVRAHEPIHGDEEDAIPAPQQGSELPVVQGFLGRLRGSVRAHRVALRPRRERAVDELEPGLPFRVVAVQTRLDAVRPQREVVLQRVPVDPEEPLDQVLRRIEWESLERRVPAARGQHGDDVLAEDLLDLLTGGADEKEVARIPVRRRLAVGEALQHGDDLLGRAARVLLGRGQTGDQGRRTERDADPGSLHGRLLPWKRTNGPLGSAGGGPTRREGGARGPAYPSCFRKRHERRTRTEDLAGRLSRVRTSSRRG
jgi:hypothetical protein